MINELRFDRASSALQYLIKKYNIRTMHIPYYLCDSIRHALFQINCKPLFYHIDINFMPEYEFHKDEYLLYPNYFGSCSKNIQILEKKYPKLIIDNAHAFFDEPSGFASFNSAYKFDLGNYANLYIGHCKRSDINEDIKKDRKEKFLTLYDKYKNTNLLNIDKESVPFCYPYLAKSEEDADILAKQLQKKGFNIYRYWNSIPKSFPEYKFYSSLVPIPID